MKRRAFITLLGGGAAAWPLVAQAQQGERMRRVGVLMGGADEGILQTGVAAFQRRLQELGWAAGRNLELDVRWAGTDRERIPALVEELVQSRPDVLLAGPSYAVLPLQKATRTIPIVFVRVSDPLGQGVVTSLARPTGNVTGFSNLEFSLIGKWLQLLKEIDPRVTRIAVMISVTNAVSASWYRMLDQLAPALAIEPVAAPVRDRNDIVRIIETVARRPHGGLIVPGDTLVEAPVTRGAILALTNLFKMPDLYSERVFVRDGGLISYGIDPIDPFRNAAGYVSRVLKGETPADLPVQQPTRFELAINLRTAKALGLTVPPTLLATADEVIE